MPIWDLILLSVGLAMDATAVSMTNGMCYPNLRRGWALATSACFGVMQGLMPLLGYFFGSLFYNVISALDHYIALILLGFIGAKMIFEAFHKEKETSDSEMSVKLMLLQGIATSIDALAVGISFAALDASFHIVSSCAIIAAITFALSFAGVYLGKRFGALLQGKAQVLGGVILIAIGVKIFVEHMWFS